MKILKANIVHHAGAYEDCTIGYSEDGEPIAIVEEMDAGKYFIECGPGDWLFNEYQGRYWFVTADNKWDSCLSEIEDGETMVNEVSHEYAVAFDKLEEL